LNPSEKGILCLTIALTAAVAIKLWVSGLLKIYTLLFSYLAWDLFSSLVGLLIPFRSTAYGYFYLSTQTIKIAIAAFMLVQIYSLAFERTPALARFWRDIVGYILLIAAVFPIVALWTDHRSYTGTQKLLRLFFLFEQTMDLTMAIFLIFISIFMLWFPVRLRRNVIVYISGFIVWSLSRSIAIHVINRWFENKELRHISNLAQMCIGLGCLLYWLIGLRREGESRTAVVGHLWNRAEAERLTEQLDSINNSLARLRRK
jgi:hypothetical protein